MNTLKNYPRWLQILILAWIIFLAEELSFVFTIHPNTFVPFWPASGIAIATLLCYGYELWPGILIGTFVSNIFESSSLSFNFTANSLFTTITYAMGETTEALLGAAAFLYFTKSKIPYNSLYNVFIFLFLTALGASAVGATIQAGLALSFKLLKPANYQQEWFSWWLGAVVSILLVTPAIVAWNQEKLQIRGRRIFEFILFLVLLSILSFHIFFGPAHDSFLLVPFAVWASIRFQAIVATTINVVLALVVLLVTIYGSTEFRVNSLEVTLLTIQAFMSVISITSLVLLAFVRERDNANNKLLQTNIELEERVERRTQTLAERNQTLKQTLDALKKAQSQLVQSEKMSTIGLLTAGIAHEINNSVNFISSNLTPLQEDIDDILAILDAYEKTTNPSPAVQAIKAKIDLAYTVTETKNLLAGMEEGAKRTTNIVRDLRTFSRLDETVFKKINLAENIDSTLTLLQHHFKDKITLRRHYEDLPKIECNPGKLNQAIMNILMNAVTAIKDKGEISVTLKKVADNVLISIRDTGTGMDKATQNQIFEPFFTTKEVGKGSGLGLAITYNIIQDHHGTIGVRSTLGKGTEFIITLPIKQHLQ